MFKWLNPTGHVMHQQFNIQQLYVLPTLYLCVLYLSENKQRLVPLTSQTDWWVKLIFIGSIFAWTDWIKPWMSVASLASL